jgi:hypothetical protein
MLKVEKKVTFVVAGIEFQEYKPAQFFKRALSLRLVDIEPIDGLSEMRETSLMLDSWRSALGYPNWGTEFLVNTVMLLQLPKPARKPKEIQNCDGTEFEQQHARYLRKG